MKVIELAGAGGVGKSTLAPLVAERLREILGADKVAALPEHGPRASRQWTRARRWSWIASHPASLLAARRATAPAIRTAQFSSWMRIFSAIGLSRQFSRRGIEVALIDQGILRVPLLSTHVQLVPRSLLPDAVLHIVADAPTVELRRIWRNKTKHRRFEGELRFAKARESLAILAELPAEELRRTMEQFGKQFCNPPFSEAELDTLLQAGPLAPVAPVASTERRKIRRCEPEACAALRARGIRWQEVDNSRSAVLDEVVERCVQEILAVLGRQAA
nr:hypothetical protein [Dechloromonas sp.]